LPWDGMRNVGGVGWDDGRGRHGVRCRCRFGSSVRTSPAAGRTCASPSEKKFWLCSFQYPSVKESEILLKLFWPIFHPNYNIF
jgi:hypothetical protein